MPRIDWDDSRTRNRIITVTSDAETLWAEGGSEGPVPFDLWEAITDDIRNGAPTDVCLGCYQQYKLVDDLVHPPYEDRIDGIYHCFICGEELGLLDN